MKIGPDSELVPQLLGVSATAAGAQVPPSAEVSFTRRAGPVNTDFLCLLADFQMCTNTVQAC